MSATLPANHRICDALGGVLVGTAVGDSIGLPMEGLSARRAARLFPGPLRQRFIGRFGMISDDTEHTFLVAQSLLEHPDDPIRFQRSLASRLRWWLVCLPAGIGFATLRAILKLWLGFPPSKSGVLSAGNGAAMRSTIIGAYFVQDAARREAFVRASTEITHRDPRALIAALAVAEVAAWMANGEDSVEQLLQRLNQFAEDNAEWTLAIGKFGQVLAEEATVREFAVSVGAHRGVSGYALQSVPVAIYSALRHRDSFQDALSEAIACGGDTDTVGAITGALVGARHGLTGIPTEWHTNIVDWPRSVALLKTVADRLGKQMRDASPQKAQPYCRPIIPLRNFIFAAIVISHGLRRLLPPY